MRSWSTTWPPARRRDRSRAVLRLHRYPPAGQPSVAGRREPVWPRAEWYVVRMPEDVPHDLVLFTAPEPNLRWRGFPRPGAGRVPAARHRDAGQLRRGARAGAPSRPAAAARLGHDRLAAHAAAAAPDRLRALRGSDRHHDGAAGRGARSRLAGLQPEHVVAQLPDRHAQSARLGGAAAHRRRNRRDCVSA